MLQLLRSVRFVVGRRVDALASLLRDRGARLVQDVPVWWCPWIHDLALVVGCAKHGLVDARAMRGDPDLALHPDAVRRHVHRVFLQGNPQGATTTRHHARSDPLAVVPVVHAAAAGVFWDRGDALDWAAASAELFPETHVLEARVERICSELTRKLPVTSASRVAPWQLSLGPPEERSRAGLPCRSAPMALGALVLNSEQRRADWLLDTQGRSGQASA